MALESIGPKKLGGEVEEKFEEIHGDPHRCDKCGGQYKITPLEIFGRKQEDQLTAEDGTDWFIAMRCPDCDYDLQYEDWDTNISFD